MVFMYKYLKNNMTYEDLVYFHLAMMLRAPGGVHMFTKSIEFLGTKEQH